MPKKKNTATIIDEYIEPYVFASNHPKPRIGWVKYLRTNLNMSLLQLGKKMGMSKQAVWSIEKGEKNGEVNLKTLEKVAGALEMKVVYCMIPKEGKFEDWVDKKAKEYAVRRIYKDLTRSPSWRVISESEREWAFNYERIKWIAHISKMLMRHRMWD